jgi:AIPR protein
MIENAEIGYSDFKATWLTSVTEGSPSTRELGKRFALKLVTQWLDLPEDVSDFVFCDGAGDGGIDIAVLDASSDDSTEGSDVAGHSWYLVQSKHGSAFAGTATLLAEGQKVIDTLDGKRLRLSSLADGLLERLTNFRKGAGPNDRIFLVFATENALSESEGRALDDLRAMGRERLGALFDVEAISIETIFQRLQDEQSASAEKSLVVPISAKMVPSGKDLLVGSIDLIALYEFLKRYRAQTGDLDRIYEKNVRRFLGGRGKVNKAMQATLRDAPERFGLYNNGITLVVQDFAVSDNSLLLTEPYIVNGCQTSRTIWEVFHQRVDSGGTGMNPELEEWKARSNEGVVVAKIVKVGSSGDKLLQAITRYTNSQNAVREKDFLALTNDFKEWQGELSASHDLYLEIQRGGWDSQKALQNSNPRSKQFVKNANAADLMKVYGAGWLGEAGMAFGKNPPFLPDGSVFKRIVNVSEDTDEPFGADDLYAAYLLQRATNTYGFGRGADQASRRQTRFLFYMIALDLLKDVMARGSHVTSHKNLSRALVKILENEETKKSLLDQAIEVIDSYMTQGSDDPVFSEPAYLNTFNSDLNAFLKWEKLGKSDQFTPRLKQTLAINKAVMAKALSGQISPRQQTLDIIRELKVG